MSHLDSVAGPRDKDREPSGPTSSAAPAEIHATALLQGQREIIILHAGDRYRLRVTANDKLILTK